MNAALRFSILCLFLVPSTALAVLVPFTGTLEFDVGTITPFSVAGSGMVDVSPVDGSFTLPAGAFAISTTRIPPQTPSEVYASVGFFLSNVAGTFGGPGAAGGTVPLAGSVVGRPQPFLGFPDITGSGAPIGGGVTTVATVSNGATSAMVEFQGEVWQTGMFVQFGFGTTSTFLTIINTGVDSRTPLGAGALSLVVPARTVTSLGGSFLEENPFAVTMTLQIPEPSMLAMQLAGAALLVGLGRRRQARRDRSARG